MVHPKLGSSPSESGERGGLGERERESSPLMYVILYPAYIHV